MKIQELAIAVIFTFVLVRVLDYLVAPPLEMNVVRIRDREAAPARRSASEVAAAQRAAVASIVAEHQPPPHAAAVEAPPATAAARSVAAATPPFIVIGFPIGIDKRNSDRRALLRELWVSEYPNIGRTVRAEFVVGLLTYQGDGHDDATLDALAAEHERYGDLALVNAREPTRDPYRGDPKCTGEKIVSWFQQVVVVHRGTQFFVKADWDTWIHTTRLEVNLRLLCDEEVQDNAAEPTAGLLRLRLERSAPPPLPPKPPPAAAPSRGPSSMH